MTPHQIDMCVPVQNSCHIKLVECAFVPKKSNKDSQKACHCGIFSKISGTPGGVCCNGIHNAYTISLQFVQPKLPCWI